ncbi:MAG TPA: hypothetical protein VK712_01920 [Verrucomicrobiae bacterium]|jgi:hypothetical protein|nr:hypothetical protein [Verrucomicrobiae bacterium]
MPETAEHSGREHLSRYFPQLSPDSVFIEHNKPVDQRADNEWDVRDLWLMEQDALDPRAIDAGAFAVFKARLYDSALTIDESQKGAYTSIREKLLSSAREIATVLVKARGRAGTEAAYCYTGIVPEEVGFQNEPFKDMVPVPGARGFELIALPNNDVHYHGKDPSDSLPISLSNGRPDGFSFIPKRFESATGDVGKVSEFAATNTPYLLTSREIPTKILEEYSLPMTAELIIKLATISAVEYPEKVAETFGAIPEIEEHLSKVRQLVTDYRSFYDSVIDRNMGYLNETSTLEQFQPDYNALRNSYKRESKALWAKYDAFRSEVRIRVLWEVTRGDWPSIDFGSEQADAFHSPDFVIRELNLEKEEMQARIKRADAILSVLDLLD